MGRILGLGRLTAPDDRDKNFPVTAILPAKESKKQIKYHNEGGWHGDQGSLPACVGYGWAHFLKNGRNTQKLLKEPDPVAYYHLAQQLDEYPGENYAGSSVRGGAKAMQQLGFLDSYLWASNIDEVIQTVLEVGPMVVGTIWTRAMSTPQGKDHIIKPGGPIDGGHCYLINGINLKRGRGGLARMQNSWGQGWGDTGNAWMELTDMEKLLFAWDGEACMAIEK